MCRAWLVLIATSRSTDYRASAASKTYFCADSRDLCDEIGHSEITATWQMSSPELPGRDAGAFRHGGDLRPHHVGIDCRLPNPGAIAAVRARDHVLAADQARVAADALGDQLGMLDEVRFR